MRPHKTEDLLGHRFGRLVVTKVIAEPHHDTLCVCKCDCGNETKVYAYHLRRGTIRSCGCLGREAITTHGMSNTRLYRTYGSMLERCYKPYCKYYNVYGGRGIKICDEWLNDRTKFFEWALNNGYDDNMTIDRINPDGDYSPDNCRWLPREVNSKMQRKGMCFEYDGVIYHSMHELAKKYGCTQSCISDRYHNGTLDEMFPGIKILGRYGDIYTSLRE